MRRSVHCEQARSFCSCVYDFSGIGDPVFTLMRGSGLQGQFSVSKQGLSAPVFMISPVLGIPFYVNAQIRITRSVHCEQARSFCSCVYDFSGIGDPVFTLMRGSGLQGQFSVSKQGLSAPVFMISPVLGIPFLR